MEKKGEGKGKIPIAKELYHRQMTKIILKNNFKKKPLNLHSMIQDFAFQQNTACAPCEAVPCDAGIPFGCQIVS